VVSIKNHLFLDYRLKTERAYCPMPAVLRADVSSYLMTAVLTYQGYVMDEVTD